MPTNYETDESFQRLMALFADYPTIIDEVALFESLTHHLYIPIEAFAPRAQIMARRIHSLKASGIRSAGINVLCTIGHVNEAWDYNPPLPFEAMMGHDGTLSKSCACPNTSEFRDYVKAKYTLVAEATPDFIWVDDDVRMNHHGVAYGCFCPVCLGIFNRPTGNSYTRETLVKAFDEPKNSEIRAAWVEHNGSTIESLMTDVAEAIRTVDTNIAIGFMTTSFGNSYSGYGDGRWFKALGATKVRPGGGFYSDDRPLDMVSKVFEVGRQVAAAPANITDCQYELENFPYQVLKKSRSSVINECTLAFACGVNGIAFNTLGLWGEALNDYRSLLQRVTQERPLWEQLITALGDLPLSGLWPAWNWDVMAKRNVRRGESWLEPNALFDVGVAQVLAQIGIPLSVECPVAGSGSGVVLCGRVAEGFSDDELLRFLSAGVLLDGESLEILTERGLSHYVGARLSRRLDNGVVEQLSDDEINGMHSGHIRDARIEFWGNNVGLADTLEIVEPGVRILSEARNYAGQSQGICMTAYENSLGGRIVVAGYAPWIYLHSGPKRQQMQNVADWLTHRTLPVRIDETVPLIPFVRLSPERSHGAVVLLNAGFDHIESVTLHVRAPATGVLQASAKGIHSLHPCLQPDGWSIELTDIEPWTTTTLFLGRNS